MDKQHPLHPNALGFKDVQPSTEFVWFNRKNGIELKGVFTSRPFTRLLRGHKEWVASVKDEKGVERDWFLTDLGIIPSSQGWNSLNFTIPLALISTLPAPRASFLPNFLDDKGNVAIAGPPARYWDDLS